MATESTKSVKSIPFSGKRKDFVIWADRFLSICKQNKCKTVVLGQEKLLSSQELEKLDCKSAEYKNAIKILEKNDIAMVLLSVSLEDPVAYSAIYNSKSESFLDGNAAITWENLHNIYEPKSS